MLGNSLASFLLFLLYMDVFWSGSLEKAIYKLNIDARRDVAAGGGGG